MKHVRNLLLLLVAGLLLTSTAWAQGDLSLGGGRFDLALATIDSDTFSASSDVSVTMMGWATSTDHPRRVGADKTGYKVFAFKIVNNSGVEDTLTRIDFASYNDKDFSTSEVALYRVGSSTALMSVSDPGAFAENDELTFSGLSSVIPDNDSVMYYFTFDSDPANVDASYEGLFLGLKVLGGGIRLAQAGQSPANVDDTLTYDCTALPAEFDAGPCDAGRVVAFDTKPPELTIDFTLDDQDNCGGNNIINLGDTIIINATDDVDEAEIAFAWVDIVPFGGSDAEEFDVDITDGLQLRWGIPDTSLTPTLDIAAYFYNLVVTVEDSAGNQTIDTLLLPYAIDNQQPVFDGDSVWMELATDVNGDGTAATGDIVQVFAYFTSNPFGEIEEVTVDMSGWGMGFGAAEPMTDPSGNRRWFSATFEIPAGSEDWMADSSASLFVVTAIDDACNWDTVSNVAQFPIDNEAPFMPDEFLYDLLMDLDSNGIVNVGDSVMFTIDATNTADLDTECEVVLDLYNSDLGGDPEQCVEDTDGLDRHVLRYGIVAGEANAGANSHTVEVTLTDDAGNYSTWTSSPLAPPIDNEPPLPVANLDADKSPCAIDLDWDMVNGDDARYFIFWDGGDGWSAADTTRDADGNLVFLDTLGSAVPPTTSWTTDGTVVLNHGSTYEFVVRTVDDADNYEWNFHRVATQADCEPPTVCIDDPASGGAYGVYNEFTIVASSPDADIASATLYVRDTDAGGGTPSAWMSAGAMTQVGGDGQQFTKDITNVMLVGMFGNTGDQEYEFLVVGTDEVGNVQTLTEANAACDDFVFTWFHTPLTVELITVNDTILPQTSCGYNVTRDANNMVEINIADFTAGDEYTVDVFWYDTYPEYRIFYDDQVTAMPYSFALDATNFPKGTESIYIEVTRADGNEGSYSFEICVPDEHAPMGMIIRPIDGQRVRRMNSVLRPLYVDAAVNPNSYDPNNVTRVDFMHSLDYETGYTVFGVQTAIYAPTYYRAEWDNRAFEDGDVVYLKAVFYDNVNNTMETPVITVILDGSATDIMLTCPQAVDVGGTSSVAGTVDFYAEILESFNDFESLDFYYKKSTDPDVYDVWTNYGSMSPGTDEGIYVISNFNTAALDDVSYDFRVIATDITGNVMWDYDDDGYFDDNTFDEVNVNSDAMFMVDNSVAEIAFQQFEANGVTFYTPSEKLEGTGEVFAPARADMTVWSQTIPMSDTLEVSRVNYLWYDDNTDVYTPLAQVGNVPWYQATFNPYDVGAYTDDDVANNYFDDGYLVVRKYDVLNRPYNEDWLHVIVLDVDPNQAVISSLTWEEYVWGNVSLTAAALNGYDLQWVVYEYQVDGGTSWIPIDSSAAGGNFPVSWATTGNVADGWVWVRAVAVDNAFNRDANPIATKVYIANALPTVTMEAPVADQEFIGAGATFGATADNGDIPIDYVQFQRKSVLSGSWTTWATDNYPPYSATLGSIPDGAYHFRVRAYNLAGRYTDSDKLMLYYDATAPVVAPTQIAGQDVEGADPTLDLTGMDTIWVEGSFMDNASSTGANSGMAAVAFEIRNNNSTQMMYSMIDPATDGIHGTWFNISGLPTGTYRFYYYGWDAVGNADTTGPIYGYISDQSAPWTSIVGYHDGRLYGYDWSGDASHVLFEYDNGNGWYGVGTGAAATGDFWWTEFDAASVTGDVMFRMQATDGSGNTLPGNALIIDAVADGAGGLVFEAGEELSGLATYKNYESGNWEMVLRVAAASGDVPIALGVYEQDGSFDYEAVYFNENLQGEYFQEDVHPDDVYCDGMAVFMVGAADGASAQHTTMNSYTFYDDLGSNGTVYGNEGSVSVNIPAGTDGGCMTVLETWLPRSGAQQDTWQPVPNENGLAHYVGCFEPYDSYAKNPGSDMSLDVACCFPDNRYAVINMTYDSDVPTESLLVVRWDDYNNEWDRDGVYFLNGDAGFYTDDDQQWVEFSTDCLYGIYAVVAIVPDDDPGPVTIEFVDAYPYCNDFVGPNNPWYYDDWDDDWDETPKFVFKVADEFGGTSDNSFDFVIKLNGNYIHRDGSDSELWDIDYDGVSQMLGIWMSSDAPALPCGTNTLWISATNSQNNTETLTWTFEVDCEAPTVVFDNYYVGKNPTITFTVDDGNGAGVDWDHVFVDVVAIQTTDTNWANPNQNEQLFFLGTFFPGMVDYYRDGNTVTITTHYELEDERAIGVAIYDGTRVHEEYSYIYYSDWGYFYTHGHGVWDCVNNGTDPWFQILAVDYEGPSIFAEGEDKWTKLDALPKKCPVMIQIVDDGSGVEDIEVLENGVPISMDGEDLNPGEYSYDASTGYMMYCASANVQTTIIATDEAGNEAVRTWAAFGDGEYDDVGEAYNYPNPFDPSADECTLINTGFAGDGIMLKIYDFGGELVASMDVNSDGTARWCGLTSDGERVANGIYFAYAETADGSHKTIKIAVIEK